MRRNEKGKEIIDRYYIGVDQLQHTNVVVRSESNQYHLCYAYILCLTTETNLYGDTAGLEHLWQLITDI